MDRINLLGNEVVKGHEAEGNVVLPDDEHADHGHDQNAKPRPEEWEKCHWRQQGRNQQVYGGVPEYLKEHIWGDEVLDDDEKSGLDQVGDRGNQLLLVFWKQLANGCVVAIRVLDCEHEHGPKSGEAEDEAGESPQYKGQLPKESLEDVRARWNHIGEVRTGGSGLGIEEPTVVPCLLDESVPGTGDFVIVKHFIADIVGLGVLHESHASLNCLVLVFKLRDRLPDELILGCYFFAAVGKREVVMILKRQYLAS